MALGGFDVEVTVPLPMPLLFTVSMNCLLRERRRDPLRRVHRHRACVLGNRIASSIPPDEFRSGIGFVLNLTPDQEKLLADYLSHYKGPYNMFWRNCTNPLYSGLAKLGFHILDVDPNDHLTPDDMVDKLFRLGLIIDWVPHLKNGTPQ